MERLSMPKSTLRIVDIPNDKIAEDFEKGLNDLLSDKYELVAMYTAFNLPSNYVRVVLREILV